MVETRQIYRCPICGIIVEVLHAGGGNLVCCGQAMLLQKENTVDASLEKHVPVIEKLEDGFRVRVGSEPHPMTEEHHIEWIELIADGRICRKELKAGESPEALFLISPTGPVEARAYCNLHGLWNSRFEG
jgi:superoxide reductase